MSNLRDFYTFPEISSQPPYIRWIEDPKLQRYIQKLDNLNVDAIAYYLVTTAPSPASNACLTAFLAHVAFIPAHRLRATHALLQQYYSEDLTDLYQIGLEIISEPRQFLSNFDPNRSIDTGYWYPNFYKWSQQKFDLRLTDKIRSQKGMSGFRRTNLGLVARATPTKIGKALTQQGYPVATHPTYLALHACLEKAVQARRFDTAQPQPTHYAEILALYRQRQVMPLDAELIVSYLDRLGTAVSNYDRLRVTSIDLPVSEDGDRTLLDTIPDPKNPLDTAILTEYQQQVDRLKKIVINLLQQLPIDRDRLLMLFYGLNLTQTETGAELNCNQTTAMRRCNRVLATLAQNIYLQISGKSPPLASEHLALIVTQSIAFCRQYYSNLLIEISQQLESQDRQLPIDSSLETLRERVCARWQIQLQTAGAAIGKLTKIINQTPLSQ
jgi:hypothetical protein